MPSTCAAKRLASPTSNTGKGYAPRAVKARTRARTVVLLPGQLPEDVRQDAAVVEVLGLLGRVDAHPGPDLVVVGPHRDLRRQVGQPADLEGLVAGETV